MARNLRERLIQAARTMRALPDVRTRPVTSLVRTVPLFCDPDTTIRDAAKLMADARRSAPSSCARATGSASSPTSTCATRSSSAASLRDAPVSTIMTTPVQDRGADVLAPEASIEMMAAGVNHLPVRRRATATWSASSRPAA